jgi:Tol biopolymer transport system component
LTQVHVAPYITADGASESQARQLSLEGSPENEISWTPDGQLLISAANTGLTLLNPQSGVKTPFLSQLSYPNSAHACSDGHVVFVAPSPGKLQTHIWRADADGGNPKELTSGKGDSNPACSPDSKAAFYVDDDGNFEKISFDGGAAQMLAQLSVFSRIAISPDGKYAAFETFREHEPKEKLALVPLDSNQPPRLLEFERPGSSFVLTIGDAAIRFSSDGKGIIYPIPDGHADNLWLQHLDGSPGKQLTDFKSELVRDFDYSFDGKQLAVVRGHRESDVVLIRDSEK